MLYEIENHRGKLIVSKEFVETTASEVSVKEKTIENWIAENPQLLFPKEQVLVIGQSISGQGMADILALDSLGNLIIVEIKRDWSHRTTVAQLLEYASEYLDPNYETLNIHAQKYQKWKGGDLVAVFREFIDRDDFPKEKIATKQRIFVVAPDSDSGLKKIISWLQHYGVPIQFIPFRLFADQNGSVKLLDISGVESEIEFHVVDDSWAGHWIFNTNETYAPGAFEKMFSQGVIAIYGYQNGPRNLEGASENQRVFAYVNGQGIRALGNITDPIVKKGEGIFIDENGKQQPDEYHVIVKWEVILPPQKALSNREASAIGYNLPVRTVFGRLHRGQLAKRLEDEILKRGNS